MVSLMLAGRNIASDKTRLALTAVGTGLCVMLILLLSGFVSGIDQQVSVYLDHEPGSLVIAQTGVSNLLGASSRLPVGAESQVDATPGVARAVPILSQFVILDLGGRKAPAYLIGYEAQKGGGPWLLADGRRPANDDEVVVDRVLARRQGIAIGDTFPILGHDFRVSGLSQGTASFMTSYLFVRRSALEPLLLAAGQPSFILVSLAPGADGAQVTQRLGAISGTSVLTKETLAQNDRDLLARVFRLPLQLMAFISYAVGALVVGMVIYTATIERRREYGALKALGAGNGSLYLTVVTQALVAAVTGAALGIALAFVGAQIVSIAAPQLLVAIQAETIALGVLAAVAMALAGSLVPARLLARLAPAEVLRG